MIATSGIEKLLSHRWCASEPAVTAHVDAGVWRELRRVLNRGEAVNALKRAIYTGCVAPAQARRADDHEALLP